MAEILAVLLMDITLAKVEVRQKLDYRERREKKAVCRLDDSPRQSRGKKSLLLTGMDFLRCRHSKDRRRTMSTGNVKEISASSDQAVILLSRWNNYNNTREKSNAGLISYRLFQVSTAIADCPMLLDCPIRLLGKSEGTHVESGKYQDIYTSRYIYLYIYIYMGLKGIN